MLLIGLPKVWHISSHQFILTCSDVLTKPLNSITHGWSLCIHCCQRPIQPRLLTLRHLPVLRRSQLINAETAFRHGVGICPNATFHGGQRFPINLHSPCDAATQRLIGEHCVVDWRTLCTFLRNLPWMVDSEQSFSFTELAVVFHYEGYRLEGDNTTGPFLMFTNAFEKA